MAGWMGPEREVRYRWAAGLVTDGRVLEVGCGRGVGAALLAEAAAGVTGVDLSPASIGDAVGECGGSVEFREGDLRGLPFGDGEFDCAVCFEALVRVAEPEKGLDELQRVLKPGGLLLLSVPNPEVYPAGNPLHLCEVGAEELEAMLRRRFAHVAVYPQRVCFASLLGDEPVNVAGETGGSPLHFVAAASDGELPPAPNWLALGENVDHHSEQERLLREWQERAVRAEAEAEALRRELRSRQD